MKYAWLWVPALLGIVYYLWSAKYPELNDKLEEMFEPCMQFLGYCFGIGVIIVLLWGMFQ